METAIECYSGDSMLFGRKLSRSERAESSHKAESLPRTASPRASFENFRPESARNTQKPLLPISSPRGSFVERAHSLTTPDSPRSRKTSALGSGAQRTKVERAQSIGSVGSPSRRSSVGSTGSRSPVRDRRPGAMGAIVERAQSIGSVESPSRRSSVGSAGSRSPVRDRRSSTMGSIVSCPDSPRSFQKMLETTGFLTSYSETRRQTKRERNEFRKYQSEVHRENSADLADIKMRTRPKVEDRVSQHALQAEKAWREFSAAIREVDAEDLENHRNHLCQIICNAGPRVSASESPRSVSARRRNSEERVENLMRELNSWRENQRDLEELQAAAQAKISDDLSDMTKDVRKRLSQLRARMRSYDSKVFALQERALEHLRETSASRVTSWQSEDVVQLQEFFALRTEARRKTRSVHMQKYAQDLRALVEKAEPAVDSYIDEEVKGLRQLPLEVEQTEVRRLQDEIRQPSPPSAAVSLDNRRILPSTSGVQSGQQWITGERLVVTQPIQAARVVSGGIVTRNSSATPSCRSVVSGTAPYQQFSPHSLSEAAVRTTSMADGSSAFFLPMQWQALSGKPAETMSMSTAIGTTPTSTRRSISRATPASTPSSVGWRSINSSLVREETPSFSFPGGSMMRQNSPPLSCASSNEPAMILTTEQTRRAAPRLSQSIRFASSSLAPPAQTVVQVPTQNARDAHHSETWRQHAAMLPSASPASSPRPMPSPSGSPSPASVRFHRCDAIQQHSSIVMPDLRKVPQSLLTTYSAPPPQTPTPSQRPLDTSLQTPQKPVGLTFA